MAASVGGTDLIIAFQYAFLIASSGNEILAAAPDLISLLEVDTGEPITTDRLRSGQGVAVIGIPGDERWRSSAGVAVAGPAYGCYAVPIEDRVASIHLQEVA